MSLYFEAASFLSPVSVKDGSFKSRVFNTSSNLKSNPATIYALVSETAKYDSLLTEIIDNSGILALEPKVQYFFLDFMPPSWLTDLGTIADAHPIFASDP